VSRKDHIVIVIFSSNYDQSASSLAARWSDYDASLLTCDDLSLAGWRHFLDLAADHKAIVGTKSVCVDEITGVLIRWPGVFPQELTHIVAEDRTYVAGEMMAFLVSWFLSLRCPVINRPTPLNLAGPAWRVEQWTHVAAQLGIPVRTTHRHISLNQDGPPAKNGHGMRVSVIVAGNHCFGSTDATLVSQARALASAAGASLLEVTFSVDERGSFFTSANLIPEIDGDVADAVLASLNDKRAHLSV
jgi:hypothetical protein